MIGLWQPPDNAFQAPGFIVGAIVPYQVADAFNYSDTNDLFIVVLGLGISVTEAKDQATVALRRARGSGPACPTPSTSLPRTRFST